MNVNKIVYRFKEYGVFSLIKNIAENSYNKLLKPEKDIINNLLVKKNYAAVVKKCEELLKKRPGDIELTKSMAFAKYYLNEREEATELMKEAFESFSKVAVEELIKKLPFENYDTVYVYNGGKMNWGSLIHTPKDGSGSGCLFSKIIAETPKINREEFFYENIYGKLLKISGTPEYLGSKHFPEYGILVLTTALIEGDSSPDLYLDRVLEINSEIEAIPYDKCRKILKTGTYYTAKYQVMYLHKHSVIKEIIGDIERVIGSQEIADLTDIFVKNKLYKKVIPQKHYAFCHNDFHKNNIFACSSSGNCYVFDWGNYSYAAKGWDMAYYFGNFEFTFEEIYERYIKGKDDTVEQIFYVLMQIYVWTQRLHGRSWTEKAEEYFIPALEFIKKKSEECIYA